MQAQPGFESALVFVQFFRVVESLAQRRQCWLRHIHVGQAAEEQGHVHLGRLQQRVQ